MNNNAAQTHGEPSIKGPEKDSVLKRIWKWLTHQKDEAPPSLQHFLPGKIMLHIKHPADLTQAELAKDIGSFLKQSEEQQWKSQLTPPKPEAILTFPLKDDKGRVLSIVPVRTRDEKQDLVELLITIHSELPKEPKEPLHISDNVTLNSVAPDWLIGSAPHGAHPPSPGSWPVEAPPPVEDAWKFGLRDNQGAQAPLPFTNGQGTRIHVAILDTVPAKIDLDEAYKRWQNSRHLIDKLWGPNGKVQVHKDIYADIELMDYSPVGHHYLMPDHGLFVAGIINAIAPEATLHLVKAFTPYGSGSTETIAQGLLQVLQNPEIGRPLIVNCSFGLNIDDSSHLPAEIQSMITLFQEIFNQLTNEKDVIVVAAAGNYIGQVGRPPANYPAAFAEVIGVGALPKGFPPANGQYQAANYSNLADDPPDTGYMAFGGEPGPGQGMLGIYTSEIPVYAEGCLSFLWRNLTGRGLDGWAGPGYLPPNPKALTIDRIRYKPNTTGWAWWAGTSFAAPIVSGILAKWCNQQQAVGNAITSRDAQQALKQLFQSNKTAEGEIVIPVGQP
ncbi:MAG: S8 family serine peptidase [Chloroflexi bacterium]|nr:S8 family serine peptidase [Chloroflexota bacterium]